MKKIVTMRIDEELLSKIDAAARERRNINRTFIIEGMLRYAMAGKSAYELNKDATEGYKITKL